MLAWLGNVCAVFIFFVTPNWALGVTGLSFMRLPMAAGQLAVIVMAAALPAESPSGGGWVPRRFWRVALTIGAIAALNFVLNLIWQTNI